MAPKKQTKKQQQEQQRLIAEQIRQDEYFAMLHNDYRGVGAGSASQLQNPSQATGTVGLRRTHQMEREMQQTPLPSSNFSPANVAAHPTGIMTANPFMPSQSNWQQQAQSQTITEHSSVQSPMYQSPVWQAGNPVQIMNQGLNQLEKLRNLPLDQSIPQTNSQLQYYTAEGTYDGMQPAPQTAYQPDFGPQEQKQTPTKEWHAFSISTGNTKKPLNFMYENAQYIRPERKIVGHQAVQRVVQIGEFKRPSPKADFDQAACFNPQEILVDLQNLPSSSADQMMEIIEDFDKNQAQTFIDSVIAYCCRKKNVPIFTAAGPKTQDRIFPLQPMMLANGNWKEQKPSMQGMFHWQREVGFSNQNFAFLLGVVQTRTMRFYDSLEGKSNVQNAVQAFNFIRNREKICSLLMFSHAHQCVCRKHNSWLLNQGIPAYLKFSQQRACMDSYWAQRYTFRMDQLQHIRDFMNKKKLTLQTQQSAQNLRGAPQINDQASANQPRLEPAFRQRLRTSTRHHTSYCHSILENDAMKNAPHSLLFYEATHSSNICHLMDHNLPHVGSWIASLALNTKFFQDTQGDFNARIASFTGLNPLSLEHFEGVPLISWGKYGKRLSTAYQNCEADQIPDSTSHTAIMKPKDAKGLKQAILSTRQVSQLFGDICYEKLFEQEIPEFAKERRNQFWDNALEVVRESFLEAQSTFEHCFIHKYSMQLEFSRAPGVNEPHTIDIDGSNDVPRAAPPSDEKYIMFCSVGVNSKNKLLLMFTGRKMLNVQQDSLLKEGCDDYKKLAQTGTETGFNMNSQYNRNHMTLDAIEKLAGSQISNSGKCSDEKKDKSKKSAGAKKQSFADIYDGFTYLRKISVYTIVRRYDNTTGTGLLKNFVRATTANDDWRHIDYDNAETDLSQLSRYFQQDNMQLQGPLMPTQAHVCERPFDKDSVAFKTIQNLYNIIKAEERGDDRTAQKDYVPPDTMMFDLQSARQTYFETKHQALFGALNVSAQRLMASVLDNQAVQQNSVSGILRNQVFQGFKSLPGETNFESLIRSLITTYIFQSLRETRLEEASVYFQAYIHQARSSQQLSSDILLQGCHQVPLSKKAADTHLNLLLKFPIMLDLQLIYNLPDTPSATYLFAPGDFPVVVARLAITFANFCKHLDYNANTREFLVGFPKVLYQWGLSLGIGLWTWEQGQTFSQIQSEINGALSPARYIMLLSKALSTKEFKVSFAEGSRHLSGAIFFLPAEFVNFVLFSPTPRLGLMLFYPALSIKFQAHNHHRSNNSIIFDPDRDDVLGNTVYYDSIFMGHAFGYDKQKIIITPTILNVDTTSDDEAALLQAQQAGAHDDQNQNQPGVQNLDIGVVDDTYASGSEIKQSESMKAEDDQRLEQQQQANQELDQALVKGEVMNHEQRVTNQTVNMLDATLIQPQMTRIQSERVQGQTFVDLQGKLFTLLTKEQKQTLQYIVPGAAFGNFKDEIVVTEQFRQKPFEPSLPMVIDDDSNPNIAEEHHIQDATAQLLYQQEQLASHQLVARTFGNPTGDTRIQDLQVPQIDSINSAQQQQVIGANPGLSSSNSGSQSSTWQSFLHRNPLPNPGRYYWIIQSRREKLQVFLQPDQPYPDNLPNNRAEYEFYLADQAKFQEQCLLNQAKNQERERLEKEKEKRNGNGSGNNAGAKK